MDFAHQTKKNKTYTMAEQTKGPKKIARHGYPFTSFWDFLQQCDSIHPLLRKIEYP
jgi:hypothetical protein